jgi:hypothetical protein
MEELSRILIEEYCWSHDTAKSRRLHKLVRLSYDITSEGTDADAIFLERAIQCEKDPELRRALEDLDEFLLGY